MTASSRNEPSAAVIAIGLCALTLASSCGKPQVPAIKGQMPVFPVSGKLTIGGEPMADATIIFNPVADLPDGVSKIRPHAFTDDDGSFRVSTYGSEDGAPPGKYTATVSWKGPHVGVAGDDDDRPEKVPPEYQSPRSSRLQVEIVNGENTLKPWDLAALGEQQTSNTAN